MSEAILDVFAFEAKEDVHIELKQPTVQRRQRNLENNLRRRQTAGLPRILNLTDPAQIETLDLAVGGENDLGNVEYKFRLVNLSEKRRQELQTQMRFRMNEGKGQAFYVIGVRDDGRKTGLQESEREESQRNLEAMGREIGAAVRLLRTREGDKGCYMELMVTSQEWEKAKSHI